MFNKIFFLIVFLLLLSWSNAQDGSGKFSGYMFGDYYYVVKNHDESLTDLHGYQFRRIYFTYDYKIDNAWSTRLRLEMSNEFGSNKAVKISPFVRDAYLKYKVGLQSIILGISPTPTWKTVEKVWGYRAVEKLLLTYKKWEALATLVLQHMAILTVKKRLDTQLCSLMVQAISKK